MKNFTLILVLATLIFSCSGKEKSPTEIVEATEIVDVTNPITGKTWMDRNLGDNQVATSIVDVTNPITGKTWMDRNLGATRVATSSTDEASFGDLYQWGRLSDGHQLRNSAITRTLSSKDQPAYGDFIRDLFDWRSPQNPNLWQGLNGVNNPCPDGYRLPTIDEWEEERVSWSSSDAAGAFASPLKLPVAGYRDDSGGYLYRVGSYGYYWSSSGRYGFSDYLFFFNKKLTSPEWLIPSEVSSKRRANGLSVRCIKDLDRNLGDTQVATSIVDVTNPITGKTWMDRNLGATQVATSSSDVASYGDLYQWGRLSDGHQLKKISAKTTLSSTDQPWLDQPAHGDFICIWNSSPYDWRSPQNDNLWQGVNGVNNPCPDGYRLPTIDEWEEELASWSSNNSAGAFASPLKLPAGGIRDYSYGKINNVGTGGYYWSSTVSSIKSRSLVFGIKGNAVLNPSPRAFGFSVRCIKD